MLKHLAAPLAALAFAMPASAAVLVVSYEGFASGRALDGAFGPQTEFQNVAYRAVFTIDSSLGSSIPAPDASVVEGSGPTSPVLAAFVEINGVRRDVTPTFGRLRLDHSLFSVTHTIESRLGGLTLFHLTTQFDAPPTSFDQAPDGVVGGSGAFLSYDEQGREVVSLALTATELVIAPPAASPPAAIPEPGAWSLMILGFAGAGAALRRRRAQATRCPAREGRVG